MSRSRSRSRIDRRKPGRRHSRNNRNNCTSRQRGGEIINNLYREHLDRVTASFQKLVSTIVHENPRTRIRDDPSQDAARRFVMDVARFARESDSKRDAGRLAVLASISFCEHQDMQPRTVNVAAMEFAEAMYDDKVNFAVHGDREVFAALPTWVDAELEVWTVDALPPPPSMPSAAEAAVTAAAAPRWGTSRLGVRTSIASMIPSSPSSRTRRRNRKHNRKHNRKSVRRGARR